MKIPKYTIFKNEIYNSISSSEKDFLFFWSLIDSSGWEEVSRPFFPDVNKGHQLVIQILEKSSQIKKIIKKNPGYFLKRFVEGDLLANYLLAAELELRLEDTWVLDVTNLQKIIFPDIIFKKNGIKVSLEIKGVLSSIDLRDRVVKEVKPYLRGSNYDNFLLLLLFPVCPDEKPARVKLLIDGYYVYEDILKDEKVIPYLLQQLLPNFPFLSRIKKRRQVFCQCFTEDEEKREPVFTLDNLVQRIIVNYFKKLEIV